MKKSLIAAIMLLAFCSCNSAKQEQPYSGASAERTQAVANEKSKYIYEFERHGLTYRLTLDVENEKSQLFVHGTARSSYGDIKLEKTFYGTCYRKSDKPWFIVSKGISGAGDYDLNMGGMLSSWDAFQYIDTKNNFLYQNTDTYKAENPEIRMPLRPIE